MTYAPSDDAPAGSNGRPEDAAAAGSVWAVGPWRVDAGTGELRREGPLPESQRVEPKVAEVLVYLACRAGQVVSREDVLAVWQSEPGETGVTSNALEVYVHRLRRKLAGSTLNIRNIRGLGYLLEHTGSP